MKEPVVILEQVGKAYALHKRHEDTLRDRIAASLNFLARKMQSERTNDKHSMLWALRNISSTIYRGECVGIIGHNGAGKSTLLKLISRITLPDEGQIQVYGQVASLLELGVGFHPDLTGRENVYLAGALLHLRKKEIENSIETIREFSELDEAFDRPVRTYSSGMYMRLGFSVAAHLHSDVVLLDEVLAVGDLRFQQKCSKFLDTLRRRKVTILLVSHNLFLIKALCNRVIYLKHGHLVYDGQTAVGIARYEADSYMQTPEWALSVTCPSHRGAFEIKDIATCNASGSPASYFAYGEPLIIRLRLRCNVDPRIANLVISVLRHDGLPCSAYSSALDGFFLTEDDNEVEVLIRIPRLRWVADSYRLDVLIWDHEFQRLYAAVKGPSIAVVHPLLSREFGVFHESAEWQKHNIAELEECCSCTNNVGGGESCPGNAELA